MTPGLLAENKQVVERFVAILNERRLDDLPQVMATHVVDHNKIIHGETDAPGAAIEAYRQQLAAFDPYHARIDEMIAEGDRVAVRITQSGVNSGAHPRAPIPTHRRFQNEIIYIFTITDGKITEIRGIGDRLGMFLQLGWPWPPPMDPLPPEPGL